MRAPALGASVCGASQQARVHVHVGARAACVQALAVRSPSPDDRRSSTLRATSSPGYVELEKQSNRQAESAS
jgi:hypothetical protein